MRASALARWLDSRRAQAVRQPRRTVLGVNPFEARTLPSAVSGAVYQDLNDNGVRDAGEPGIAGVKIQLMGKTDAGQVVKMDAVTDAQGNYTFTGVASGEYMLMEKHAAGFKNGSANPGSDGGTAHGPNVIVGIDVCHCDTTGYNFGEVPTCSNQSHGKGSGGKGSGGKGSHDKCDSRQSHGKGSDGKGSGGKQSHDKCSTGSNGKGSDGKGSGGKGSHDKCMTGSNGKGSGNKGSNGKGSHDMCGGKVKGNNGVGNGLDPQPPGNPRMNDGVGTAPGNPGNRGGK